MCTQFEPLERWCDEKGWQPFEFQRAAWEAFLAGGSGLINAPTGFGKTLAAWGGPVLEARSSSERGLQAIWLTPLRALATDTAHQLSAITSGSGCPWRVELRTGDTSASMRRRQRERMPEALVTTPESLSVLLSYADSNRLLSSVRAIVVDEWHELMGSKRGVQTELALSRVRALSPGMRTWGLSATIGNLDEARRVLVGASANSSHLIRGRHVREIEVRTLRPEHIDRFPWSGHLGLDLLPSVVQCIEEAETTLVFTNTRSQAEIWFQELLRSRLDWIGSLAIHHGSIDRDVRMRVEEMIHRRELRAVVCTSSLDLGVDFAPVDQVIQIGSPKGVARLMQRAGRSGHRPGVPSRIVGVPTNALELAEFAAAREAVAASAVESRAPLRMTFDVLVQHLITVGIGSGFEIEAMREEVESTHAYRGLSDAEWQWCLDFVERGGQSLTAYPDHARLVREGSRLSGAGVRLARRHRMSIGTITSDVQMRVRLEGGTNLGTIEETFIAKLAAGDRFVIAGRVVELLSVREMTATVRTVSNRRGIVPRWAGGRSPLSTELSASVRRLLSGITSREHPEMALLSPMLELQARWSHLPAPDELLIESVTYRGVHHHFVFTFAGRLANEGLAALLAHRLTRLRPMTVESCGNDYGTEIAISADDVSDHDAGLDEDAWRQLLSSQDLERDLLECVNAGELRRRRFRDIARIAGLLYTGYPGERRQARHLQASSELYLRVFEAHDPENLLLEQAAHEVLAAELEVERLRSVLEELGTHRLIHTRPARFTPLAFPLWSDRIRSQTASSERLTERIRRMAMQLEREADRPARRRSAASAAKAEREAAAS